MKKLFYKINQRKYYATIKEIKHNGNFTQMKRFLEFSFQEKKKTSLRSWGCFHGGSNSFYLQMKRTLRIKMWIRNFSLTWVWRSILAGIVIKRDNFLSSFGQQFQVDRKLINLIYALRFLIPLPRYITFHPQFYLVFLSNHRNLLGGIRRKPDEHFFRCKRVNDLI